MLRSAIALKFAKRNSYIANFFIRQRVNGIQIGVLKFQNPFSILRVINYIPFFPYYEENERFSIECLNGLEKIPQIEKDYPNLIMKYKVSCIRNGMHVPRILISFIIIRAGILAGFGCFNRGAGLIVFPFLYIIFAGSLRSDALEHTEMTSKLNDLRILYHEKLIQMISEDKK